MWRVYFLRRSRRIPTISWPSRSPRTGSSSALVTSGMAFTGIVSIRTCGRASYWFGPGAQGNTDPLAPPLPLHDGAADPSLRRRPRPTVPRARPFGETHRLDRLPHLLGIDIERQHIVGRAVAVGVAVPNGAVGFEAVASLAPRFRGSRTWRGRG